MVFYRKPHIVCSGGTISHNWKIGQTKMDGSYKELIKNFPRIIENNKKFYIKLDIYKVNMFGISFQEVLGQTNTLFE